MALRNVLSFSDSAKLTAIKGPAHLHTALMHCCMATLAQQAAAQRRAEAQDGGWLGGCEWGFVQGVLCMGFCAGVLCMGFCAGELGQRTDGWCLVGGGGRAKRQMMSVCAWGRRGGGDRQQGEWGGVREREKGPHIRVVCVMGGGGGGKGHTAGWCMCEGGALYAFKRSYHWGTWGGKGASWGACACRTLAWKSGLGQEGVRGVWSAYITRVAGKNPTTLQP